MFCEAYMEIAGWLKSEPIFTCTKQGVPYCTFSIFTTNNTSGDNKILEFNCFVWQGQQYNLIKQLNLTTKDEVYVKGMFSMKARNGLKEPLINLQVYVNYIKVLRSRAAERAMNELNSTRTIEEIPVKRQIGKNENYEVKIDKKDNPWG